MERELELQNAVRIDGPTFLGCKGSVTLSPSNYPGIWWERLDGTIVQVTLRMLDARRGRICLVDGANRLPIIEHLLAVGYMVPNLLITQHTKGLPYDGSGAIFWNAVLPNLAATGKSVTHDRHPQCVEAGLARKKVLYLQENRCNLLVEVHINYGYGTWVEDFTFPRDFAHVAAVKTQGWPKQRYWLAQVASVFGWPHLQNVTWPQHHAPYMVNSLFAAHRAYDILACATMLAKPGCHLVGKIQSFHAGHREDIKLLEAAAATQIVKRRLRLVA